MRPVVIFTMVAILFFILPIGQSHALVLKIATLSPEGSSWMQLMRQGAKEVAQITNKRVRFKFYPGGVMGSDKAVLRKISIGQLQGGAVVSGSLAKFFPDNQIYSLPLKFKSFQEVDYIRKRMDRLIIDGLEKGGFVTFGLAEGGFAYLMSKMPIETIEELSGQKVWIPEGDSTSLETLKAFDISPIPLSIADVRAALQTDMIDTVAISPIGAVVLQWHTQISYLLDVPLMYIYGLLAVDRKAFSKISPGDKQIVRAIMGRVFSEMDRQSREQNIKAMDALRNQGIQFLKPSDETLSKLYTMGSLISKRLVETGKLSKDMVNTFEAYLDEYRSGQAHSNE